MLLAEEVMRTGGSVDEWRQELPEKENYLARLQHRLKAAHEVELEAGLAVERARAPVFVGVEEFLAELKKQRDAKVERCRVEAEVAEAEEEVARLKALIAWAEEPPTGERVKAAEKRALDAGMDLLWKAGVL